MAPPALHRGLLLPERLSPRVADRVIATNESIRNFQTGRGGCDPAKIAIVRTGPDDGRMVRGPAHDDLRRGKRFLVCYIGVMGPQDGVDVAVQMADVLVHQHGRTDFHVALLGFGDCLAELRQMVHDFALEEWVSLPGRVGDEELLAYLSTGDVGM